MKDFLSYGRQSVNESDVDAVVTALRSDWLTQGPLVEEFENHFAEVADVDHAVACSNGTAALHLASLAAGLGPGKAAVVPAITFVATANAVRMTGAEVLFADVDPDTGRMTEETLLDALRQERSNLPVQAVLPVHLGGAPTSIPQISEIASGNGITVIEDACHALGGRYEKEGRQFSVGSCEDSTMACFSFHPVKPITTGEGGMVSTNNMELASFMRQMRSHGVTRHHGDFQDKSRAFDDEGNANPWYYEMPEIGYNYRLSDIQCALGLSQLRRLEHFQNQRAELVNYYETCLKPLSPTVCPAPRAPAIVSGHHLFTVLIDFENAGISRADVMNGLRKMGIGTQVHYIPVPNQPYYRLRYGKQRLPGAEAYYARCLSLPLFADMTKADVDRVVVALKEVLQTS